MKKWIVIAVLAAFAAAAAPAADLPPGKWWQNPQLAQRLGLQPEQQARLDAIFHAAANELIDGRADIGKAGVALRAALDRPQLDRAELQRLANALSQARGRLFEREVMMLADMRSVLTDDQWTKVRAHLDRRQGPRHRP